MSFDIGINFRNTGTFVTDGANETYSTFDSYPTTRGGVTFGWESGPDGSRDRDNTVDRRLAGINFGNTVGYTFRIDLPTTGAANVHIAAGDAGNANGALWDLVDSSTVFQSLTHDISGGNGTFNDMTSGDFGDATDVRLNKTTWPGSESPFSHTFTSTIFRLKVRAVSITNNVIAHIRIVSSGGSGGPFPFYMATSLSGGTYILGGGVC